MTPRKICPVVYRRANGLVELLAFTHPTAGRQIVKGTIEHGEPLHEAALRELYEESGLQVVTVPRYLGQKSIGDPPVVWHFCAVPTRDLPDSWGHYTEDGGGHTFAFFWHPIQQDMDERWAPIYHDLLIVIRGYFSHYSIWLSADPQ